MSPHTPPCAGACSVHAAQPGADRRAHAQEGHASQPERESRLLRDGGQQADPHAAKPALAPLQTCLSPHITPLTRMRQLHAASVVGCCDRCSWAVTK